jgi:hypothetical protein
MKMRSLSCVKPPNRAEQLEIYVGEQLILGPVMLRFEKSNQSPRPGFNQAEDFAETPGIAALETCNSLL